MRDSRVLTLTPGLALALVLFGCGTDNAADQEPDSPAVTAEPTAVEGTIPAAMEAFRDDGNVIEIEIEGNDQIFTAGLFGVWLAVLFAVATWSLSRQQF